MNPDLPRCCRFNVRDASADKKEPDRSGGRGNAEFCLAPGGLAGGFGMRDVRGHPAHALSPCRILLSPELIRICAHRPLLLLPTAIRSRHSPLTRAVPDSASWMASIFLRWSQ